MIKSEHLYPNKDWFESRNKPVPESIEGLADNQLLIKLGGIKELAKLRGYNQVSYDVIKCERDYAVVKCKISWKALMEAEGSARILEDPCSFEDVANATLENTNDFCAKFLETIATNRSFVRCVRNFLNINIVGDEEIDKSKNKTINESVQFDGDISPQSLLKNKSLKKLNISEFEDFKEWLRSVWINGTYQNANAKDWQSFKDIPAKECRKLISIIN